MGNNMKYFDKCINEMHTEIKELNLTSSKEIAGLAVLLTYKYSSARTVRFMRIFIDIVNSIATYKSVPDGENPIDYWSENEVSKCCELTNDDLEIAISEAISLTDKPVNTKHFDNDGSCIPEEVILRVLDSLTVNNTVKILDVVYQMDRMGLYKKYSCAIPKLYDKLLHKNLEISRDELMSYVA